MCCRDVHSLANPAYPEGFPFTALPCVAPYCACGGVRVVSTAVAACSPLGRPIILLSTRSDRASTRGWRFGFTAMQGLAAHRASGGLLYLSSRQDERGEELPTCTPTLSPPRLPSMLTCALPILKACSPSCQRPWHHATWRGIVRRATAKRRRTWRGTSVGS